MMLLQSYHKVITTEITTDPAHIANENCCSQYNNVLVISTNENDACLFQK